MWNYRFAKPEIIWGIGRNMLVGGRSVTFQCFRTEYIPRILKEREQIWDYLIDIGSVDMNI